MTCDVARERCSGLLDEALDASERAELDVHLAGCAECRRELDDLRRTVAALRAIERPRAPLGFVDRVMAAARPAPWHRRLRDCLAGVRILRAPVEAAAVVVVASLAVYVFYRTPELQQAARPEAPVVTPDVREKKTTPGVSSGMDAPAPAPVPPAGAPTAARRSLIPADTSSREDGDPAREKLLRDEVRTGPGAAAERANEDEMVARQKARLERAPRSAEGTAQAPSARPAPETQAAPPPAASAENPSVTADRTESASLPRVSSRPSRAPSPPPTPRDSASPPALAAPPPMATPRPPLADAPAARSAPAPPAVQAPARLQVPGAPPSQSFGHLASKGAEPASADVIGRLTVRDRAAAGRDLASVIAGVGAVETGRREEGAATIVEVVVARERYPIFQERLERLGAWRAETNPAELPDHVRVTVRIAQ